MPSVPGGLQGAQGTGEAKSQGQEPEPSEGRFRRRESAMGYLLVNIWLVVWNMAFISW